MKSEPEIDFEGMMLGRLSAHDVDPATAERIRERAHAILADQRQRTMRRSGLERFYSRFLEPVLVSTVVATYLVWAVSCVLLLYRRKW
jgi:hypothetical protein